MCKRSKDGKLSSAAYSRKTNEQAAKGIGASTSVLCRLPKDEGYQCGTVGAAHSAFYFDSDFGECIEFFFKGCGGNQNRFTSKQDCLQGCRTLTLCGKSLPLMDFAGNIKRCEPKLVPCPLSHECVGHGMESSYAYVAIHILTDIRSTKLRRAMRTSTVLETTHAQLHMEGKEPAALVENGAGKRCDPDTSDSCPEHYSCQQAKNLEHICCTRPLMCPEGMDALREDGETDHL
ncbi:hypothetical protein RB195_010190 [Necator americanus]|uniref:BPTI/Kunitz inhibitor domain-containing protein n=1 Tax=Necator americanus TaxID=51031 RepID=A0ABR1CY82_NECAM